MPGRGTHPRTACTAAQDECVHYVQGHAAGRAAWNTPRIPIHNHRRVQNNQITQHCQRTPSYQAASALLIYKRRTIHACHRDSRASYARSSFHLLEDPATPLLCTPHARSEATHSRVRLGPHTQTHTQSACTPSTAVWHGWNADRASALAQHYAGKRDNKPRHA